MKNPIKAVHDYITGEKYLPGVRGIDWASLPQGDGKGASMPLNPFKAIPVADEVSEHEVKAINALGFAGAFLATVVGGSSVILLADFLINYA